MCSLLYVQFSSSHITHFAFLSVNEMAIQFPSDWVFIMFPSFPVMPYLCSWSNSEPQIPHHWLSESPSESLPALLDLP